MSLEGLFTHTSLIERAIGEDMAARVRGPLRFERYALLDRGSYEHAPYREPGFLKIVCELAGSEIGSELSTTGARVVRLRAGDYLLARHDDVQAEIARTAESSPTHGAGRAITGTDQPASLKGAGRRRYELVLDVSPAPAPAEIHYRRRGQVFFRVPCTPCSLAIVERTPAISCNHTYVSKLARDAEVVRLVIQTIAR